jgi:ATP-dependent DNA helicase RecG
MLELHTPVQYVKGVGPRIADLLAEKGITTVEDLLYYLPFRYEDRINPRSIAELRPGEMASLIGEVRNSGLFRTRTMPLFQLVVGQGTATIRCVWFRGTYLEGKFRPGQVVALYGKVEQDERGRQAIYIRQPEFEILSEPDQAGEPDPADSFEIGRIVPVYSATGRLTSRWFRRVIRGLLDKLEPELPEAIPAPVRERVRLIPRREAFWKAHWPGADEPFADLERARTPAHVRLIFEELFFLELGLEIKRRHVRSQPGIAFQADERAREMIKKVLPFHPTAAQKRVLKEIADDMRLASPMRRLLQGDVGSGKTIVAFQAAILAIENGYQVALMAPTEILATQHYLSARRILENAGYRIVLLTGSIEQDRKRDIRRHIREGHAQLVIGTHALIQETVEFANLGLVIVDEQHRFGVMQRFRLMKKPSETAAPAEQERCPAAAPLEPDTLVMTATPIPRTLALTLYGDLDVSTIDELPPGRTPILTRRVGDERAGEVWQFVRKQVAAGHQAYVVYPLIEEQGGGGDEEEPKDPHLPKPGRCGAPSGLGAPSGSGTRATSRASVKTQSALAKKSGRKKQAGAKQGSMWSGLKAAVKMHDELRKKIFPDLRIGLLHGRMDADEKDHVMRQFQRGEIDVLVSTTVIEVGVDVPNASVMVVEHAERFGLSQLHQLRGRIGRGAAKSYCILMTGGKISPEGERRLDAMVRTTDGFQIAELDLELRGPGEFFGTRQAGIPDFRVANLVRDLDLLQMAKNEAAAALSGGVSEQELRTALMHVRSHWQRRYGLVEVG